MSRREPLAELERLGQWEKLEGLSARFGLPFIPEYELGDFRNLYHPEIREALGRRGTAPRGGAMSLARRGRLRRLSGDDGGAAEDFKAALDLDPACAPALGWLGELDLGSAGGRALLTRALARDKSLAWAYLYRGAGLLLAGQARRAAKDFAALLRLKPRSCLGQILLGLALEKQGRRKEAARRYRLAAAADPTCAATRLLQSRAESDPRWAARACEETLNADPIYALITLSRYRPGRSWAAYLAWMRRFAFEEPQRAGLYYRQEDIHYSPYQLQEFADSENLRADRPRSPWAAALVARGALRCPPDPRRLAIGLEAVRSALAGSPRSGWIRAWRGLAWIKAGKPDRALKDFGDCLRRQPYYHRAYAWRGALLRRLGRPQEALRDLDRAIAMDEQYGFALHERSLARRALGDFAGAALELDRAFALDFRYNWVFAVGREPGPEELAKGVAELGRALSRQPRLASLWTWRGQAQLQRRRFSEAFSDFERALRLDPHHALGWGWYGRGLFEAGRAAEGAVKLAKAAELEPESLVFSGWLAEAELRLGRRRRALARLDRTIAGRPSIWWPYHLRALCHLDGGQPRKALRDLRTALHYAGRRAENYFLEARARLALSELEAAEIAIGRALVISPNFGRAYVLRAEIRRRQGRHEAVLQDYRTAYEKFPYLFNAEEKVRVEALLSA